MQIELKCKINVKNEKRKPNLPMLPRFAPVAYSNFFLRPPSVGSAAVSFAVGSKAHCRSHCKQ